jgi:UDPglucose 6-dehydrogenase
MKCLTYAKKVGANIDDLAQGIGLDKRIGKDFLKTGPGFGGSCFPKGYISAAISYQKRKSKMLCARCYNLF